MCSIHSLPSILAESKKNVTVYYAGAVSYRKASASNSSSNLRVMRLFEEDEEKLLRSASKLSVSKIESKMEIE